MSKEKGFSSLEGADNSYPFARRASRDPDLTDDFRRANARKYSRSDRAHVAKVAQESDPEDMKDVFDPRSATWASILSKAALIAPPRIGEGVEGLGDTFLNAALEKATMRLASLSGYSSDEAMKEIMTRLRENRVARKSAVSCVRFLRDVDPEWLLACPDCGESNEPGWETCDYCLKPR